MGLAVSLLGRPLHDRHAIRIGFRVTSSRTLRTTCVSKERKMEIYERSRQRNHNHNVSASSSLAWAHRRLGDSAMASTHGFPNQESKINYAWPIASLTASRPAMPRATDGVCRVISDGGATGGPSLFRVTSRPILRTTSLRSRNEFSMTRNQRRPKQ